VLKCTEGKRSNVEANIYDLTPVPTQPGFKAVFKSPLPEGEILIHLFNDGGMSVSDAKSLLAGNCGLQPETLTLEMKQGGQYQQLRDHQHIYRDQTVYVRSKGGSQGAETSQTAGMIPVKLPSEGVGCVAGCQQNMHCFNLWLSLFFWGTLIATIILAVTRERSAPNDFGFDFEERNQPFMITGILCGVFFLCYIIEACMSSTQKYLCNIEHKDGVHRLVDRLQRTAPQIVWKIQCYHYETRTRIVSYTDAEGRSQTRFETYTVRVNTHYATQHYRFDAWDDVSGKLPSLTDYKLTKLNIGKQWMFADAFTEADYNTRQHWFIQFNDRDVSYDFSTKLRIPGHREKILAEVQPGSTPCFLNIGWYWVMNLLGLSLPFRWYFTSISGRRDFNLIKRIQKSVPIMQTWILPTMTVLTPFQMVQVPQQAGMVYNQNVTVNVQGAAPGTNVTVNVGHGNSNPPVYR